MFDILHVTKSIIVKQAPYYGLPQHKDKPHPIYPTQALVYSGAELKEEAHCWWKSNMPRPGITTIKNMFSQLRILNQFEVIQHLTEAFPHDVHRKKIRQVKDIDQQLMQKIEMMKVNNKNDDSLFLSINAHIWEFQLKYITNWNIGPMNLSKKKDITSYLARRRKLNQMHNAPYIDITWTNIPKLYSVVPFSFAHPKFTRKVYFFISTSFKIIICFVYIVFCTRRKYHKKNSILFSSFYVENDNVFLLWEIDVFNTHIS